MPSRERRAPPAAAAAPPRYRSFAEFWPHYVREHSRPATRALHVAGSLVGPAVAIGLAARTGKARHLWWWPVIGYGFAWTGHLLVERNRPATFRYPLWSLFADYVMVAKTLTGTMERDVARYLVPRRGFFARLLG